LQPVLLLLPVDGACLGKPLQKRLIFFSLQAAAVADITIITRAAVVVAEG
jgi:hypothetical protein